MCRTLTLLIGAALLWTDPVYAHYAFAAEFDSNKPVTLQGNSVKVEWTNPHGWIQINVRTPAGKEEVWAIETGTPNALMRRGITRQVLMPGTAIIVEGYGAKD